MLKDACMEYDELVLCDRLIEVLKNRLFGIEHIHIQSCGIEVCRLIRHDQSEHVIKHVTIVSNANHVIWEFSRTLLHSSCRNEKLIEVPLEGVNLVVIVRDKH